MKRIKGKPIAVLLAILLVISASAGVTLAYFSDYEAAMGQASLKLAGQTSIDEGTSDTQKQIVIRNAEGSADVVVRVAVYGPDAMKVTLPDSGFWEKNGDFYYYRGILAGGRDTGDPIKAELSFEGTEEEIAAAKAALGDSLDIIVVHESAPAIFGSDNKVQTPEGWDYVPSISAPAQSE